MNLTALASPSRDLLELGIHDQLSPTAPPAADAFQQAFADIGGANRLAMWADRNPDLFFAMYAKPANGGEVRFDAVWCT